MKLIWELLFKRTPPPPLPYNNIPPGEIVHGLGEEFGDSKKIIETMYCSLPKQSPCRFP